ncbi:MAG: HD domain-containing protein [Chloroflexota bacterium]
MQYKDNVYGSVDIDEPLIETLMHTPAVRRLQGVLQHGITGLIGITTPITRFDHSVGAMLLVRRLGGSLQEQVAALLHDVSHTAFSHVIDYVFDGHDSQSYHDEMKEQYLEQTELPTVLVDYGLNWRDFIDEAKYPLLEQPAPRLCADRLDYFLRDSLDLGLASEADVQDALEHLVVHDGRIMVDNAEIASWLAYTYLAADMASWANLREVGLYELTARAIRRALHIDLIQPSDFWRTDEELWRVLQQSDDAAIQRELALVNTETVFTIAEDDPTFLVSTKIRSIDPEIVSPEGTVTPLSEIDRQFAAERRNYHRQREGQWPVRVIAA